MEFAPPLVLRDSCVDMSCVLSCVLNLLLVDICAGYLAASVISDAINISDTSNYLRTLSIRFSNFSAG